MIHFRCHRCKRQIAVPEGYVGKKVKCPACSIVTIVPDIPGAQQARTREATASAPAAPPPPPPPVDPLDQLAAVASGEQVYDGGYEEDDYDQGGYERRYEQPAPRRVARGNYGVFSALAIVLYIQAIVIAAYGTYFIVNTAPAFRGASAEGILNLIAWIVILLLLVFSSVMGGVACGTVARMGRRLDSLY